jgi:dTDP-4-amino-4,6-dideoxygalactose transaminase
MSDRRVPGAPLRTRASSIDPADLAKNNLARLRPDRRSADACAWTMGANVTSSKVQQQIPFNKPALVGREFEYIAQAIGHGHSAGDGVFTRRCQAWLEETLGVQKALLTTSCTDALEMCALLLDLQPGDEVIVPSFTFVSTANAFVLRGAHPVFADVRSDTLNIDETKVEQLVSPRTRVIVPVHYGGVGCEMDVLCEIGRRRGVAVVEDNAHGLLGKYRGRFLGTFGSFAAQSFHETKNVICGEGGALIVNDPCYVERAEIVREKGTDRSKFFRGEIDKYTWVDVGSSHLPSDILAAFLLAQLEKVSVIQARRRRIWERYRADLDRWARDRDVRLPFVPAHCEQSYHLFYLILPDADSRQHLIDHLRANGVLSVFHYLPLHLSPMGRMFGGGPGDCPVTESIADRLLRLPLYYNLGEEDQARVIAAITSFARVK